LKSMGDCIFCRIIAGHAQAERVYESSGALAPAILDVLPDGEFFEPAEPPLQPLLHLLGRVRHRVATAVQEGKLGHGLSSIVSTFERLSTGQRRSSWSRTPGSRQRLHCRAMEGYQWTTSCASRRR